MPAPQKGTPLPAADHVLRYISKKHVDRDTMQINGAGFLPRPAEDDGASCNWMESFPFPVDNQCKEIRARKRIQYEKRGKLARLNVERTIKHINSEAKRVAVSAILLFIHDPYPPEEPPEDPSHAIMTGLPQTGTVESELVGDLFLDCIVEVFDVVPD